MRFFASALPGVGALLREEIRDAGLRPDGAVASDGRNDLVRFSGPGDERAPLRLSEDVFAEVASLERAGGLRQLVAGLCDERGLQRALSAYAAQRGPLRSRMTVRVVARVRSERRFRRTALRDVLTAAVLRQRPRWRVGDPADLELWALETARDRFTLGLRLSDQAMRQRGGRREERAGALRPTVAAAMVRLAGGPRGTLADVCCGAGTVLSEAMSVGWPVLGSDLDARALAAARGNLPPGTRLLRADARRLPLCDGGLAAVVANLPFGRQFRVPGSPARWLAAVLAETARVTAPGGRVVLLAPPSGALQAALRKVGGLRLERRVDIRLLGTATAVWQLARDDG